MKYKVITKPLPIISMSFLSSVTLGAVNTLVEKVEHPFLFQSNIEELTPVFQRGATAQSFLPGYVQLPNYD